MFHLQEQTISCPKKNPQNAIKHFKKQLPQYGSELLLHPSTGLRCTQSDTDQCWAMQTHQETANVK